jgi:hypothetical protein
VDRWLKSPDNQRSAKLLDDGLPILRPGMGIDSDEHTVGAIGKVIDVRHGHPANPFPLTSLTEKPINPCCCSRSTLRPQIDFRIILSAANRKMHSQNPLCSISPRAASIHHPVFLTFCCVSLHGPDQPVLGILLAETKLSRGGSINLVATATYNA